MSTVYNWFPIEFKNNSIRVWEMGRATDADAPRCEQLPCWTENGRQLFWPSNKDCFIPRKPTEDAAPHHFPGLTRAVIQQGLLALFPDGVETGPEGLTMTLHDGQVCLDIQPPAPGYPDFHLVLRPRIPLPDSRASYRLVQAAWEVLQKHPFDNGLGTQFQLGEFSPQAQIYGISKPELFFRSHGIGNNSDKWEALQKSGPLSHLEFRDRELNCLVVASRRNMGLVKHLIGELKEGKSVVDSSVHFNNPWPRGWSELFHFKALGVQYVWMNGPADWEAFSEKIADQLRQRSDNGLPKFDLSIVLPPENAPGAAQWALQAALVSMEWGIPCQADLLPRSFSPEEQPQFLRHLALNGYVKAGGIPWLLPSESYSDRLVIIGVGSTPLEEGVAGYCTLFQRDGTFRLGNTSYQPSFQEWVADLSRFVQVQVAQLAREDNWQEKDQVELVFHLPDTTYFESFSEFKSQIKAELEGRYEVSISFLVLEYDHQNWLWDPQRRGKGPRGRAACVPEVGKVCCMVDWSLVQLRSMDHPEAESPPLRITLLPESDNLDIQEFTRQVFRFAAISWRHYGLGDLPATLEYGNILTERLLRLHRMGKIPILERVLRNHPQFKTWFL